MFVTALGVLAVIVVAAWLSRSWLATQLDHLAGKSSDSSSSATDNNGSPVHRSASRQPPYSGPNHTTARIRGAPGSSRCPAVSMTGTVLEGKALLRDNYRLWVFEGSPNSNDVYEVSGDGAYIDRHGHWEQRIPQVGEAQSRGQKYWIYVRAVKLTQSLSLKRQHARDANDPVFGSAHVPGLGLEKLCVTRR